jgi:Uma2 family endonuclease
MSADEFAERYSNERVEFIRGVVVEMDMPGSNHGKVCTRSSAILMNFADLNDLGHVVSNDSWVALPTPYDPTLVLGPDVYFVSYDRVPRGDLPDGTLHAIPELVVEVKSPSDRKRDISDKIADYLAAGVSTVLYLDPETRSGVVYTATTSRKISTDDTLELPDILPGFSVPVAKFFA